MTGNFTDWTSNILDIGPIYPFVGWEVPMAILLLAIWIVWHIVQIRMENRQMDNEARTLRQGENLQRVMQEEHTLERM